MNITIKESMLIRKCLGHFVSSQLLDFDKSPLFMDLMTKLKEYENFKIEDNKLFRKAIAINESKTSAIDTHNAITKARIEQNNNIRKTLNKELRKYNFQTICNKKVLDMIKEERSNTPKNYVKNRLSYQEWLEIHHLNKPIKTYDIDDNNNITLNNK